MYGEWLQYLKQIHEYLQQQNDTLRDMDRQLQQLREEWVLFRQQSGQPVKHEYRFDLLKVEQLQGNLHIGVKPDGNGSWMEQLTVDNEAIDVNSLNPEAANAYAAIRREIAAYFTDEAEETLRAIEQKYAVPLDDAHRKLVLLDVEKQIDGRIRHYLHRQQEHTGEDDWQPIVNRVKQDIAATFETFICNYGGGEHGEQVSRGNDHH